MKRVVAKRNHDNHISWSFLYASSQNVLSPLHIHTHKTLLQFEFSVAKLSLTMVSFGCSYGFFSSINFVSFIVKLPKHMRADKVSAWHTFITEKHAVYKSK